MRIFGFVAALMLCVSGPAAAEVVAVCGKTTAHLAGDTYGAPLLRLSQPLGGTTATLAPDTQIALWHDASGYDLLTNWGGEHQRSLRADGAEILGDAFGAGFVHLVVARAEGSGLEHFLFSLDDSKSGKMVWTAASDTLGDDPDDVVTVETVCVGPK